MHPEVDHRVGTSKALSRAALKTHVSKAFSFRNCLRVLTTAPDRNWIAFRLPNVEPITPLLLSLSHPLAFRD